MNDEGEDESPVSAGRSCSLPSERMDALWGNLFYPYAEKTSVLSYAETALEMSRYGVPTEVVSCNRLVLLHGPPGTGQRASCTGSRWGGRASTWFFLSANCLSLARV